jgi:glycosyltransferase involved in cell wall biosynthesis
MVLVGRGSEENWLKANLRHAEFLGTLRGIELARVFAGMDVFLFPSSTDTFGLVVLEAMASGTPVAAFPAAGPVDLIPGSGAGALAPTEAEGLKEAALACLELDRPAVRAFAEQFSWRVCAEEFRRNLQPYPEPEKSRFWRRLRRLARLRRGPPRSEETPPARAS